MLKFVEFSMRVIEEQIRKLELKWDKLDDHLLKFDQKSDGWFVKMDRRYNGWLDKMDRRFNGWLDKMDNKVNRRLYRQNKQTYGLKGHLLQMFGKMQQGVLDGFNGSRLFAKKHYNRLALKRHKSGRGILRIMPFKSRF